MGAGNKLTTMIWDAIVINKKNIDKMSSRKLFINFRKDFFIGTISVIEFYLNQR